MTIPPPSPPGPPPPGYNERLKLSPSERILVSDPATFPIHIAPVLIV